MSEQRDVEMMETCSCGSSMKVSNVKHPIKKIREWRATHLHDLMEPIRNGAESYTDRRPSPYFIGFAAE